MKQHRILVGIFTILLMLAAACGSTNDDTDAGENETPTEVPETTDEPDADPEPTDDEPANDPAPEDDPEPVDEPAAPLTASYQGVSETEIKIGVAAIDPEQILETFGVDLGVFDVPALYNAMAADVNANGGVLGRNVTVTVSSFLPVGAADSERVCTELMEDEKVFVVIGQYLQDNMLCITDLNGHPYVGHFGESPDRQERSNGLLFATEMEQTRQRVGGVTEMIAAGDLNGKKVGIYYEGESDQPYVDAVRPLLDEAGIEVVGDYSAGEATGDAIADGETTDAILLRMQSDGAEVLLNLSGIGRALESKQRIGWIDLVIAMTNGQAADRAGLANDLGIDDEYMETNFAVTTNKPTREEALEDPGVQKCIELYQASDASIELDLEDTDIVNGIVNHCRAFALTIKIMEAAGADLTPDSFKAGAEGLGSFDLPAMLGATMSADKHSAGADVRRYVYDADPDIRDFVPVGDPIPTEPVN